MPAVKQQLTLGYIGNRFNSPTGSSSRRSAAVVPRGRASLAASILHVDALTGRWLYRLSPLAANELRGQFARDLEYETPHTPLPQEPAISVGGFAPQVSIAPNGFSYGTPSSIGRIAYPDERRLQLADTFTLAHGRHLFSFGADWSRITDRIAAATNAEGTFLYDSGTTNGRDGGLIDWITDYTFNVHAYPNGACPSINAADHLFCFRSYTQGFSAASTQFATHELAFFAEDALRLPHSLSLTLGARYDYTLLPPPQNPNPALDQVLSSIGSPVAGASSVIPEDRNNVGPRVSLAWSPARGRILTAAPGLRRLLRPHRRSHRQRRAHRHRTRLHHATHPHHTLHHHRLSAGREPGLRLPLRLHDDASRLPLSQTTSALVFSNRFRLPAVQRATLSLERSTHTLDVRAGYAMAIATQLPQSVDLNIAPSTNHGQLHPAGRRRHARPLLRSDLRCPSLHHTPHNALFGPISALVSNANATYHSFNTEARLHTRGCSSAAATPSPAPSTTAPSSPPHHARTASSIPSPTPTTNRSPASTSATASR